MSQKLNMAQENYKISLDDLTYSSPDKKYSFHFSHLENGIFLLSSKGFADDHSIKAQIAAGDRIRTKLAKKYPNTPFHLIWDISELKGASIRARYRMLKQAALTDRYTSISAVGANNIAKSYIRIVGTLSPNLKLLFFKSVDEALAETSERLHKAIDPGANFKITPETNTYALFIDLWQEKPDYLEIGNQKYKYLKLNHWTYRSHENNFIVTYSILESNIIVIKCEGFIKTTNIEKTYSILEEIMFRFGFISSENKFYTIVDLRKAKGITLNARKLTNHYEELYKERAHMVIMMPSPIIHFALKVQKAINLGSFRHWIECSDVSEALELIANHKKGCFSVDRFNNSEKEEPLVIPETKQELIELALKLNAENQQLKSEQNEHIQRILEITGRMTWDETFKNKLQFLPINYSPFTDVYNALAVVHEDFKEIIREKLSDAQKFRESEDKYWNLINLANDIIALYQDNECMLINSRISDVLGYSPEEAKTKVPKEFIPIEEHGKVKNIIENLTNGTPYFFETQLYHKSGKLVPVSISVGVIVFEGKPATMYIIRDITSKKITEAELDKYRNQLESMVAERTKQLEKEILERETAEKSDRLKSAFLSNMSHEIRTPMNAIIAFSNFLRNPDISHSQREEYINYIQSSGQSLLNLINDIIDISKIEAKQINIQKISCSINPILEELYTLFEETRKNKGCAGLQIVLIKKFENTNLIINTDPYRIKQILSNLLHNALKFTESGSIEFGYEIKENSVDFFVKDTGIGIPEEKLEFIFQRFGKLEYSGKNKGGTGLGLAISQNLAKLLDGKLTVESTLGKGSTFHLTIPFNKDQQASVKNQTPEYIEKKFYNWENKKVLVAEDEDLNFKVIQIALQNTNAEIIRANDGYEAIEIVLSNPDINLILMDIQMPHMDGYEALTRIKQINYQLPIIAQTAFAMIEEKDSCLRIGFNDYISKPIKIPELLMKMDKYMI